MDETVVMVRGAARVEVRAWQVPFFREKGWRLEGEPEPAPAPEPEDSAPRLSTTRSRRRTQE